MVVQDDSEEITDKGSKEEDEKKAESDEKEEEKPEEKPKSDYGLEMKCEEVKHQIIAGKATDFHLQIKNKGKNIRGS